MCGIAGFTIAPGIGLDRTPLARLLLAGIAERGTDATGYGYHRPDGSVAVHKESLRLREFVEHVSVPEEAGEAIFHVRGYTKGVPSVNDNNHPVRYGRAVVVHNGHLDNDDELFRRHGAPRSTPHITVDSEAIAMLADHSGDIAAALTEVRGSAAVGVLWDGEPGRLTVARRASRTLHLGHGDGFVLFASTPEPLELAARATGRRVRVEEIAEGRAIELREGRVASRSRFKVDRRYVGVQVVTYPPLAEKPALLRLALSAF
jgi:glucosamine 6-phosphate synthetase-like amidotransferase/phosphosugar isomerase protein